MITEQFYSLLCKLFGFKFFSVKPSQDLKDAISVLNWRICPECIIYSSRIVFLLINVFFFVIFLFLKSNLLLLLSFIFSCFTYYLLTEYPKFLAKSHIVDSLSESPIILTQIIAYLKINPNLEVAIKNAVSGLDCHVSKVLHNVVKKSMFDGCVKEHLSKAAVKLGRVSSAFKRSLFLVRMSLAERDYDKRVAVLNKSLNVFLKDLSLNIQMFSQKLLTPTLLIFGFGTVLPLILISVLPILNFFNESISVSSLFFVLLLINFGILLYTNHVLKNKPVLLVCEKFDDNKNIVPLFFYSVLIFLLISFPGFLYLFTHNNIFGAVSSFSSFLDTLNTISIVWGLTAGLSFFAYFYSKNSIKVSKRMKVLERELPDVLYHIANDVDDGHPVESSFLSISKLGTGFSDIFRKSYNLIKNRYFSVEKSFFDNESGVLRSVPSVRIRKIFRFLSDSANKGGEVISSTLFSLSDHLNELRNVEKELENKLEHSLSMIRNTLIFFALIVCGLVVVLNGMLDKSFSSTQTDIAGLGFNINLLSFFSKSSFDTNTLQLVSGVYLLLFTITLTRFIVYLKEGNNKMLFLYELAKTLPITAFIFTVTLLFGKSLFGIN